MSIFLPPNNFPIFIIHRKVADFCQMHFPVIAANLKGISRFSIWFIEKNDSNSTFLIG